MYISGMKTDRNPMRSAAEVITITRSKSKSAWYASLVGKDVNACRIDLDGDAIVDNEEIKKLLPHYKHKGRGFVTSGEFRIKNF